MKKQYIIGGLAIVGAIALFAYLKPTTPKRNSEGFFGASGTRTMSKSTSGNCRTCYDNYSPYDSSHSLYFATNGYCRQGDKCRETKSRVILAP